MEIELWRYDELADDERRAIDAWFDEQFSHTEFTWADKPWRLVGRADAQLIGHVGLVRRTITVRSRAVDVAGVGAVMTRAEYRRRGVATGLLARAANVMRDDWHVDFGLLLCRDEVAPVYEGCGWQRVGARTRFEQPGGQTEYPRLTMILSLRQRGWPSGDIDLRGLPW